MTCDELPPEVDPISDSLRHRVLKASDGHCALCGATEARVPLYVDFIISRAKGGKSEPANLQVICSLCQRTKRDQEAVDLRSELVPTLDAACPFCSPAAIEAQNGSAHAIKDKYPVTPDHMLIIPYRHQPDFFSMTAQERRDAEDLILYLRNSLLEKDSSILGFNIGCNNGEAAGQTIMHMHWHLIPRRTGDTPRPRGGVRGVIPSRMLY
jgi:diadenosine tetraphosphate (Ap4A) HIT family hydrolase